MTSTQSAAENFERQPLAQYAEKAYLDYSMYVVLDRALPQLADGLKPVQRRIIYAMGELGLSAQSKHKKSARTIGDVIGKFHPHGDSACYEAMVLMAQPFSTRYPLVDGQGNFGSPDDPKSFAAMRYTESRLTPYAKTLLAELDQGTVDWQPNFDGTLKEPQLMPARLPNVLLNGGSGIAVGMATDIPPHNMREVVAACLRLLAEPKATVETLMEHIKAPDFPGGCEIVSSSEDIRDIYTRGTGSVRTRARWRIEDDQIVIDALPHQASPAKVLEQIAQQMRSKKLPMLEDLRDESDYTAPVRLVLVPRSRRVDLEQMMSHLFATTDLEKSTRVNLNTIGLDGRPGVRDLATLLREWLAFRTRCVRRRLQHRLAQVQDRLHVLAGLLIAYLNIDEVIAIIREAEDPKLELIARFQLSERQADAILDLKLRHLAKLEEFKLQGEQDELAAERDTIERQLGSTRLLKKLIGDELAADAKAHGDERRSQLIDAQAAQALDETALLPSEPITIVLSKLGWVRAAKGHDIDPRAMNYREGDDYLAHARGRSNWPVHFLDSSGRAYTAASHELPSARGLGEPLTSRFDVAAGARFVAIAAGTDEQRAVLATSHGYGFIATLGDLATRLKAGKQVLTVPKDADVIAPTLIRDEHDQVAVATSDGYLLLFGLDDLPTLTRGKGNKLIAIPPKRIKAGEESVIAVQPFAQQQDLLIYAGKRHLRLRPSDAVGYQGTRARRGNKLPRGFQRVERLEADHATG